MTALRMAITPAAATATADPCPGRKNAAGCAACRPVGSSARAARAARGETVTLGLDEYEAIRLIDREGLQQEQAAAQMGVARTTVQAMVGAARRKIADCLVEGKILRIEGGDVAVCERREGCPHRGGCCGRQRCAKQKPEG